MIATATALKIVGETPENQFKKGGVARFVNVGDGWGLKFYTNETDRDYTYDKQKIAYHHGIAPNVGHKMDFKLGSYQYYGYLTEMADVIKDKFCREHNVVGDVYSVKNEHLSPAYLAVQDAMYASDDHENLVTELECLGYDPNDMHWGNVGYMPDGRMVAIDFDLC
jgi:hypothetical protein